MGKNRVRITIGGAEYVITSDDDEAYMISVGEDVDHAMDDLTRGNPRVSTTMAAVLTALDYCDKYKKESGSTGNLRGQMKDYLEDSSRTRMELDEARREISRLQSEVQSLRMRLSGN